MYGMVVMMALTAGSEAPEFGRRGGGCNGGCRGGCSGYVYSGCYGGGCYGGGCYGGYYRGGCYGGGCYGSAYYSSGCRGSAYYSSGCHGSSYHHGCHSSHHHHHSHHHGCCGGTIYHGGCHGGGTIYHGSSVMDYSSSVYTPSTVYTTSTQPVSDGNSARLEIKLPTSGQLTIDDYTVPTISDRHSYVTSPLKPGEKRNITFKSQGMTKEVTVTAGQTLQVELTSTTGSASASK